MTHDLRVKIHGVLGKRYLLKSRDAMPKRWIILVPEKPQLSETGSLQFWSCPLCAPRFPHRVSVEKPALIHSHIRQIDSREPVRSVEPWWNYLRNWTPDWDPRQRQILHTWRDPLCPDIPFGEKASDRDYKENLVSIYSKAEGKLP